MKNAIRVLLSIIILFLIFLIGKNIWNRYQTKESYRLLEEKVVHESEKIINEPERDYAGEESKQEISEWYVKYGVSVDFDELSEINKDIVAWIQFDQMDISYPILLGRTNEEYLRTDCFGKAATAGSIFMDSMNRGDFLEYHTIIYGHNMRNGSMFGKLKQYKEKDFYEGNDFFTIYTPDKILRYQIFSCHDTDAYGTVYTVGFSPNEQYKEFLDELIRASWYQYDVSVSEQDRIVTLSTCTTKKENRFVIHGKLVDEIGRNP